ncbi:MAG: molybdopterin-dependent oxidoreductase [Alphaproteobacteria bacterium]|nr:molybdopterin-dependent oxidoreductase [Alphaproteobacteria bacterium]MBV8411760.1 molybdopterin-dependent oxidoreductase [Alphaproteobacteria bacterium]
MSNAQWHKTACNLCYVNCGLEVAIEDGRIAKVRGDKANPKSQGYLCNKAARIPYYAHHKDRLTTPLRRRADGGFEAIGWETAIAEIAGRVREIHANHGGQAFALYGGGGQGNHAGGAYANAVLRALGSRNTFNALAQEKTGDFWVNGRLFGSQTCHTAEDVHHCDLLFVLGCNPWIAHGFPNARDHLNRIRKDSSRKLIVVDPRRTETAELADLHLAVRPGADAFLLAALLGLLVQRDRIDHDFLEQHTAGHEQVIDALRRVPIAAWAAAADVALADLSRCADMIAAAKAMVVRVELGIQQGVNSTLNSYLEKLLILLTGSLGRPGTNQLHTWLAPLWGNSQGKTYGATGDEVIAGLLPPNSFPQAILADHPERLRAVFVDSSNPANTVSDTQEVERALRALDLLVVVDVAMTETARLAHYVLPASSQYEKCEFTLFNFEFPTNYFHVRPAVLPPLPGTLAEPEIYSRLARALGILPGDNVLAPLSAAAGRSRMEFDRAFQAFLKDNPATAPAAALVLYNTLGPTLPNGTASAATLWPAAHLCAKRNPQAVRRALDLPADVPNAALAERLFERLVTSPQGTAFSRHEHDEVWSLIDTPDRKIRLVIPEMLDWLDRLDPAEAQPADDFPFVLAAGQRRMFNANQIFRDPAWRKSDPEGALLIHPLDLAALETEDGSWVAVQSPRGRIVVRAEADPSMRRGQLALPHGFGQAYPAADGERLTNGPRINLLTQGGNRDPIAGTPYHKHVAVRLEKPTPDEAATAERLSRRIHGAPVAA